MCAKILLLCVACAQKLATKASERESRTAPRRERQRFARQFLSMCCSPNPKNISTMERVRSALKINWDTRRWHGYSWRRRARLTQPDRDQTIMHQARRAAHFLPYTAAAFLRAPLPSLVQIAPPVCRVGGWLRDVIDLRVTRNLNKLVSSSLFSQKNNGCDTFFLYLRNLSGDCSSSSSSASTFARFLIGWYLFVASIQGFATGFLYK
jgi:hypothetical protein